MAKTDNLGLNVWGENENSGTWLAWRLAMAGPSDDSNMKMIDAWAKTIEDKIANVQSELTFDTVPTEGSDNPVTSGGIKMALDQKQDELFFDETPIAGSDHPVTSGGVYDALQAHVSKPDLTIRCTFGDTSSATACQNSTVFAYSADEVRATYEKLAAADEHPVVVSLYGDVRKGGATEGHTLSVTDVSSADEQLHVSFLLTPSLIEGLEHVFHAELTFSVGGGSVTSSFVVEPIDGTTDIGLDDVPTEGSENLVTSGGVWDALEGKADGLDLTTHMVDTNIHVTADEKTAWSAKQAKITASGLLKGNGQGGVTAAVAGADYAAAAHDHEGTYCTPEELEEGLEGKAPTFSPMKTVTTSSASYIIEESCTGVTLLVSSANLGSNLPGLSLLLLNDGFAVGAECEIIWVGGTKPIYIVGGEDFGLHHTLSDDANVQVQLTSLYSVAVLKKIDAQNWVISGDITL